MISFKQKQFGEAITKETLADPNNGIEEIYVEGVKLGPGGVNIIQLPNEASTDIVLKPENIGGIVSAGYISLTLPETTQLNLGDYVDVICPSSESPINVALSDGQTMGMITWQVLTVSGMAPDITPPDLPIARNGMIRFTLITDSMGMVVWAATGACSNVEVYVPK